MNLVVLTGRLTKDIDIKSGSNGKVYGRFTLAVPRPLKKDETDFINCVAFGKTAEVIGDYCRKGHRIGITGRIQVGRYETVNKEKRNSFDVIVDSLEFLENKGKSSGTEPTTENVQEHFSGNTVNTDDEFPF